MYIFSRLAIALGMLLIGIDDYRHTKKLGGIALYVAIAVSNIFAATRVPSYKKKKR